MHTYTKTQTYKTSAFVTKTCTILHRMYFEWKEMQPLPIFFDSSENYQDLESFIQKKKSLLRIET